jgi:hypothetical protein
MRFIFFGAMVATLLVGCTCSESPTPADALVQQSKPPLATYVNLDLRKLEEGPKAELAKLLAATLPEKYRAEGPWAFEPWFVWRSESANGQNGFILFQGLHIFVIPGQSHAAVHLLDDSGKLLHSVDFSTGWRIDIDSASLQHEPTLKGQIIAVRSSPVINGREVSRQVYGVINNRVALLWLEDSGEKLLSNIYHAPNHTIGPDVPKRTAEEWEQALASVQPTVVLEALTWLGGDHRRDLSATPQNVSIEDLEAAKLVAAVRQRPGVRKALGELSRSANERIHQAAKVALAQLEK